MHGVDGRYFVPGRPVRVKLNPKNNTLRTTIVLVLVLETPARARDIILCLNSFGVSTVSI